MFNKSSQKWDGLVGELVSGNVDMVTMHLTINPSRKEAIDFTSPFMETEMAAVAKKSSGGRNRVFFFLSSFTLEVWLAVLAANFVITFLIWLFSKVSPFDRSWTKVHAYQSCSCDSCMRLKKWRKLSKKVSRTIREGSLTSL